MYDPNRAINPNQVAYNWLEGSTAFQPSHNIPDSNAMGRMQEICNDIANNSGILKMSKIVFFAMILIIVGVCLMILFLLSTVVLSAVSGGLGGLASIGCLLSIACIITGACIMALMKRQIAENKRQQVT